MTIVFLTTLAWLLISLLIISEPSPSILLFVFEFYAVLALLGSWFALLAPNAYRSMKAAGWKGLQAAAGYLLPLPLATALLVTALVYEVPLKLRLDLSEGALINRSQEIQAGEDDGYHIWRFIGLFRVQQAYARDGCTIFVTDSFGPDDEGGLAYCTGRLPCGPTVEMNHIEGRWWRWNYWSTNERC